MKNTAAVQYSCKLQNTKELVIGGGGGLCVKKKNYQSEYVCILYKKKQIWELFFSFSGPCLGMFCPSCALYSNTFKGS